MVHKTLVLNTAHKGEKNAYSSHVYSIGKVYITEDVITILQ